jgi:hypothetical protein
MGAAENKRLVKDYFDCVSRGDPGALDFFSDDVNWWVVPGSDMGGLYEGKPAVLGLFAKGIALYSTTDPFRVQIDELVAEAETVCAQVVIEARTAKGGEYRNHYHFVFKVRDGKIRAVKEYVDTLYAHRVLFG